MNASSGMDLPAPARYRPWMNGRYEVTAGLRPLGSDFGQGEADSKHFQLDREWEDYRRGKLAAHGSPRHVGRSRLPDSTANAVALWMARTLAAEYPQFFALEQSEDRLNFECRLTGETLLLTAHGELIETRGDEEYRDALDALACRIQEDHALVCTSEETNWLAAVHVCHPSGWHPDQKLGQEFMEVHAPVPGFERLRPAAPMLVRSMVERPSQVRFVWGFAPTRTHNRYPLPEVAAPPMFDASRAEPFWVSVERQVLVPFAAQGASLFLIRPYLIPAGEVRGDRPSAAALATALRGMPAESARYKGIHADAGAMAHWLETPDVAGDAPLPNRD